jgi:hypothetical protein
VGAAGGRRRPRRRPGAALPAARCRGRRFRDGLIVVRVRRGDTVGRVVRAYITVDALEAAVAAAEAHGGTVVTAITDVPGMGRYAAVLDSEGNEIGLWENPPAS